MKPLLSPRWLLLSACALLVTGCDESMSVDQAKEQARKAADSAMDMAQSAKEQALKVKDSAMDVANSAKEAWNKYQPDVMTKFAGLRTQLGDLQKKLEAQDFSEARKLGEMIDQRLDSKTVAQSVDFLRVGAVDGTEKAKAAIQDFMAKNQLDPTQQKVFNEVQHFFTEVVDKRDMPRLVFWVVYVSLWDRLSENAELPADFAAELTAKVLEVNYTKTATTLSAPPVPPATPSDLPARY